MVSEVVDVNLRPGNEHEKRVGAHLFRTMSVYETEDCFKLIGTKDDGSSAGVCVQYIVTPDEGVYYEMPVVVDDGFTVSVEVFVDLTTGERFAVVDDDDMR